MHSDDPQKQLESIVNQVNTGFRAISNEERTKITKDDAGTQRLLVGYQNGGFSNGSVGAKLSQVGVDVLAATSDQLIWSTDFNNFKIVSTGTTTITPPSSWTTLSTQTATIAHGQSSTPSFLVYANVPSYGAGYPQEGKLTNLPAMLTGTPTSGTTGSTIFMYAQASADSTNLYINLMNLYGGTISNSPAWTFKYYIIKETAA